MSNKTRKYALYLDLNQEKRIDDVMHVYRYKSKSAFINEAISYYCDYLFAEKATSMLPEETRQLVHDELYDYNNRLTRMLFKLCVEYEMLASIVSHIIYSDHDSSYFCSPEYLNWLRGNCVKAVSYTNGVIKFDDIEKYQGLGSNDE